MRLLLPAVFTLAAGAGATAAGPGYDPLRVDHPAAEPADLTVRDARRDRDIPVRVYLPAAEGPAPVVLFSHGLGGSRAGSAYLGTHWAGRGYAAVFLQHPGGDEAVWKDAPAGERMAAMQQAANPDNFRLRVGDVRAALDRLDRWNRAAGHPPAGRLDLGRVGMAGHSFGAVTTQAVAGQAAPAGPGFADPRVKAAVMLSPSGPRRGADPKAAFGGVKIPWLLLTGTRDAAPFGDAADPKTRLAVFPALPPGGKYELVLGGAEHSAFTDRPLPGDPGKRNPNHHRAVLAVTTAFWDAHLRDDAAARGWLDGDGPRGVLGKADRWQKK
jgi:predicted dienelactone hydrolase